MSVQQDRFLVQLNDLIGVLNNKEKDVAKKHIIAYETNLTAKERKMFQLFMHLLNATDYQYDSLKKKISPQSSEDSFNRLIKRTIDRVQESLTISVNIKRKGAYSDIFRERFHLRKKLMEAYILQGRGLGRRALLIYNSVIKKAKMYELYDECIESLTLKQTLSRGIKGLDNFETLNQQIEEFHDIRDSINTAKSFNRKYFSEVIKNKDLRKKIGFLNRSIKKGKTLYNQNPSNNLLSHVLILEMELHYLEKNVEGELSVGENLIQLLKSNKSIFSTSRIAVVNLSLANTVFDNYQFKAAYDYAEESMVWSGQKQSMNQGLTQIQQIKSLFFLEKYEEAIEKINSLIKWPIIRNHAVYRTQLSYFLTICYFALKKYEEATKEIYDLKEIEKDREGWNIWVRTMRILLSLEQEKNLHIDYDIENFRKHLSRIDLSKQNRPKLVLTVLTRLALNRFEFNAEDAKLEQALNELKSNKSKSQWDPKSPEMILFHDWFMAKREKREYRPDFSIYRLAN